MVISIIAVLIAILVPAIGGARNSARKTATTTLITTVANAISQFKSQKNRLPGYFSQAELGHAGNTTSFTQMENALLDLAGGVDPSAMNADHVIDVTLNLPSGAKTVRVNTLRVGASDGPGFINMTAKGVGTKGPQSSGMAPAWAGKDQDIDPVTYAGGTKFEMPDIIDAWGRPIILWSRNEAAGTDPPPRFAKISAPTTPSTNDPPALFYWHSNQGYLKAPIQRQISALGEMVSVVNRERSMEALLGDPVFPNPTIGTNNPDPADMPVPLSARGDFVLQSAGVDGVFLNNSGEPNLHYRYLPAGLAEPGGWSGEPDWKTLRQNDDLIQAGS